MQGNYFVTPHAVRQFQDRIARLEYDEARQVIIDALAVAPSERYAVTRNGKALRIKVKRPFCFRAIIAPGEGALPAVITILRACKPGKNKKLEEAYHATAAH